MVSIHVRRLKVQAHGGRYDYTGLTEKQSLGTGWELPFHPDDMAVTGRKWRHSLATGDPYDTEYRCRRHDGQWRWMLGRALPLRNKRTGQIEKWFGTCTDVHEAVAARFSAKRMVSHFLSTLCIIILTAPSVNNFFLSLLMRR